MREIKFRAWDKKENKMEYCGLRVAAQVNNTPRYEPLQQYTGLKDKNGKEIYEGDVFSDDEYLDVIVFGQAQFGLIPIEEYKTYTGHNAPENGYYFDSMEIIGNIYENPELLEAGNDG